MFDLSNSIFQEINDPALKERGIELFFKRDDLIHSEVSGNKWRKLMFNIELCKSKKKEGIVTFGGAYSNHLLAVASACNQLGLTSVGIVRGDELNKNSNAVLSRCDELGMRLVFISRTEYSLRNEKSYLESIALEYPSTQIIPEGGANYYGMIGCQKIMSELPLDVDHVFVAQGTSTTSAGILLGLLEHQTVNVVPVMKGYDAIAEMKQLFAMSGIELDVTNDLLKQVNVLDEYHFGGYGKYTTELLEFIQEFYRIHQVKLDPVYTGKVAYAMMSELKKEHYSGKKIAFIHTGGLHGVASIEEKSNVQLFT